MAYPLIKNNETLPLAPTMRAPTPAENFQEKASIQLRVLPERRATRRCTAD
jgi:hypothetical protein